jgi:hypothetical protein
MSQKQNTTATPLPRVLPRKTFFALPLAQQLAVLCGVLIILIALLPALLDPARATNSIRRAIVKPRSSVQAITRLHSCYDWLSEVTPGMARIRRTVLGLQVVAVLGGSLAGRASHVQRASGSRTPLCFGGAGRVRARATLAASTEKKAS